MVRGTLPDELYASAQRTSFHFLVGSHALLAIEPLNTLFLLPGVHFPLLSLANISSLSMLG